MDDLTVGEAIARGYHLWFKCSACKRELELHGAEAMAKCGANTLCDHLARLSRCSDETCGAKGEGKIRASAMIPWDHPEVRDKGVFPERMIANF